MEDNTNNRYDSRSKSAALTRAKRLRKEGDAEITKLKAQGSKIDAVTESIKARIDELEVLHVAFLTIYEREPNHQNETEQRNCFVEPRYFQSGRVFAA